MFSNESAFGQHLNSNADAPVINRGKEILLTDNTEPVVVGISSFLPQAPAMDSPTKDSLKPKLYMMIPLPSKGQGLIAVQNVTKIIQILFEKPL